MAAADEINEATSVTEEEIHPLKTLEELLKWQEPKSCVEEIQHVTQLCSSTCSNSSAHPLTLVCHDMKGGYLDDRYTQLQGPNRNDRIIYSTKFIK